MADDNSSDQEKTEDPSPRKLEEAKKKGEVAKSKEVPAAMTMAALLTFAYIMGGPFFRSIATMFTFFFSNVSSGPFSLAIFVNLFKGGVYAIIPYLAILFALFLFAAVTGNLAVVGFIFSTESLKIDFSRIKPFDKLKEMFASKNSLVELLKNVSKILVFMYLSIDVITDYFPQIMALSKLSHNGIFILLGNAILDLLRNAAIFYFAIGIADWSFQKYSFHEKMKMTKQEVKDEYKNSEGDPQLKGQIKQKRRDILSGSAASEVKGADVVITNPTHFAVAIKYDDAVDVAPRVVAKGADFMAQQIKKVAKEANVKVIEAPPLARFLHRSVEVGDIIPEQAYKAVAEILIQIFKMNNKTLS